VRAEEHSKQGMSFYNLPGKAATRIDFPRLLRSDAFAYHEIWAIKRGSSILKPLVFLLLFHSPLQALEKSGKWTVFGGSYLEKQKEDITSGSAGAEASLKFQQKLPASLRLQADGWFRYDGLNESAEEVTQAELEELSVDWRKGSRKIKAGVSTRVWEGTDVINPMDVIHSKNWRDPLNTRKLAAPGLFYDDSFGNFSIDVTYLAIQQKARLPGSHSPWYPRDLYLPIESNEYRILLDDPPEYELLPYEERDQALENNVALRIQYIGSSMDLSLAAFEGSASTPLLAPSAQFNTVQTSPEQVLQADGPIRIRPIYYRQRAYAFAFSWSLGSWIFRGAANHIQPLTDNEGLPANKAPVPSWSELGVFGVEKTLYFGNQMLTLLGQAVASRRPSSEGLSMLSSLYKRSYMAGIRWAPNEKWTWLQAFFQEQEHFSSFYHTEISWNFREAWNLTLDASFLQGRPDSVLGTYDKNDQALLKTSYSF
jgi:hypothetical protein